MCRNSYILVNGSRVQCRVCFSDKGGGEAFQMPDLKGRCITRGRGRHITGKGLIIANTVIEKNGWSEKVRYLGDSLYLPNLWADRRHSTVWSQKDLLTHWWDWNHQTQVSPAPYSAESKMRLAHGDTGLWMRQNTPHKLLLRTRCQLHYQSPTRTPGNWKEKWYVKRRKQEISKSDITLFRIVNTQEHLWKRIAGF